MFAIYLFVLAIGHATFAHKWFPAPLEICAIDDEQCMVAQANKFSASFSNGSPKLKIPILEPLYLGTVVVATENQQSITYNMELTDTEMHNFTTFKTTSVKGFSTDTSKPMKIVLLANTPQIIVKAKHRINGKILVLPVVSSGVMTMNITDLDTKTSIVTEPYERDGRIYLRIADYQISTNIGNIKLDMTNFFNGQKQIRESVLQILNDNWQVLSMDVQPKINEALEKVMRRILEELLSDVPYDEYFLKK